MPAKLHIFDLTYWLLKAVTLLTIFIAAILALALGAILVAATNLDGNHLGIPESLHGIARINALQIAGFAISVGLICVILILFALRSTAGIIRSAISGDPFVSENAKRLAHIGWLLLGVEVLGFMAHPIFERMVAHLIPENLRGQAHFGFDASPIGLLAVLLIFVLAQIFRRGSEMRAELETTV